MAPGALIIWAALVLAAPVAAAAAESPQVLTLSAGVQGPRVFLTWQGSPRGKGDLLLVLPGFAQHSGTGNLRFVADLMAQDRDVAVLDFRGTGASHGQFDFGASEAADVQAALAWARGRYSDVNLLGFSLGAYAGLRAAVEGPLRPRRCLLVSAPENIDRILSSGGVVSFLFKGWWHDDILAQPEQGDLFFRWGPLLMPKPLASALAADTVLPLHFLVGAKDQLVYPEQSRAVFRAAAGPATYTQWSDGRHAEHMALLDPRGFSAWVAAALAWQGQGRHEDPFASSIRRKP